jgi:hypothetical protein
MVMPIWLKLLVHFKPFEKQPDPNLPQTDPNLPPGIYPHEPMDMSMAPPDDTFMVIGKASKAALNHKGKREEWFMDSGATNHFCCERDMLHAFVPDDPMHPVYVRIADKTLIKRSGVGNICSRTCIDGVAGSASCGKAGGQRFGRYFRLPHCFQAHCAGDLASAGPWHSSRVPTAFPCPWPGGERLRCRVPWGTCT